ncbi:MAG: chloride channel protein [Gammaproteobacteria bacterium]|nr:chloride channel protein [Gammaproteobacteria bacterium]
MSPVTRARHLASFKLAGIAAIVGAAAGGGAIVFWMAVAQTRRLLFGAGPQNLYTVASNLPWWKLLLWPTAGGLLVGLFIHRFMQEQRPHGVADVIEAAAIRGGHLSSKNGFAAALVSAASIGCGASVGREGPIVHLGATLGSWFARKTNIPPGQIRRLIGCGVAAGIAASFNAPIAGAVFAIEVVIGKYTLHTFAPIAISTVVGTSVARLYYGSEPAFTIPVHTITTFDEIPAYALLGIISAATAIAFLLCISTTRSFFERVRCPAKFRPAIAGLVVGVLAIYTPQVLGVGYETTSAALHEALPATLLVILIVTKLLAAGISLGGGFGGGVFSPSLFLGAMSGGAFGTLWESFSTQAAGGYGPYTIVGMGAVAGAVLGAPLSTTLIVFEMTGDYPLTLAVMLAVITSSILVNDVWGRSYFQWQLQCRGVDLIHGSVEQLGMQLRMEQLMSTPVTTLSSVATLEQILTAFDGEKEVYVLDDNDQSLLGSIPIRKLLQAHDGKMTAADFAESLPTLKISDDLVTAIALCNACDATSFPVVSDDDSGKVIGCVTVKRIMYAYQGLLDRVAKEEHSFTD